MRVPIADEVKAGREMLLHVLALSLSVRREAESAAPISRIGTGGTHHRDDVGAELREELASSFRVPSAPLAVLIEVAEDVFREDQELADAADRVAKLAYGSRHCSHCG